MRQQDTVVKNSKDQDIDGSIGNKTKTDKCDLWIYG